MDIKAQEITGAWPEWARKVRDNGALLGSVIDGPRLRNNLARDMEPDTALHDAVRSKFWRRVTSSGAHHIVGIWYPEDGGYARVFAGKAGGYGYDKTTAAMAGMPVGEILGGEVVVLTDHCGLDRMAKPAWACALREITLEHLPSGLFRF